MSQTFYLLAERAKNYSGSEEKNQSSDIRLVKEPKNSLKYSRSSYNKSTGGKKRDGIIICI